MTAHRSASGRSHRGGWVGFVQRYGWRAYALPFLSVLTIAVLVNDATAGSTPAASARQGARGRPTSTSSAGNHSVRLEGLTGDDAGFDAGSTPAPVVIDLGDDAASCATNDYQRRVVVSISKQHLWACAGSKQVNDSAVTTGATVGNNQTPVRSWRVQAKQRDRYLVGPGYKDYVHYWVPFDGDFGLHDASWQTMPFGSTAWPTRGSHGCVHVPTSTMAWLYRWADVGSTVVTVES